LGDTGRRPARSSAALGCVPKGKGDRQYGEGRGCWRVHHRQNAYNIAMRERVLQCRGVKKGGEKTQCLKEEILAAGKGLGCGIVANHSKTTE